MRLWHIDLIPYLPKQQLLGQWRDCVAIAKSLAEKGTPNNFLVNRILDYPSYHFQRYGCLIAEEMRRRGYKLSYESGARFDGYIEQWKRERQYKPIYPAGEIFKYWHNLNYLNQCMDNLEEKHDCGGIPDEEYKKLNQGYRDLDLIWRKGVRDYNLRMKKKANEQKAEEEDREDKVNPEKSV